MQWAITRDSIFITPINRHTLKQNSFDYLVKHKSRSSSDDMQKITYSFNDIESTIVGHMEEEGNNICLYEYRGKYIGTEFLISFSKNSVSYKLLSVDGDQDHS